MEFELIKAIIAMFTGPEDTELIILAKEKLANFLNSKDPNRKYTLIISIVKYLGLVTLKEILEKDKSQIQAYKQYIV